MFTQNVFFSLSILLPLIASAVSPALRLQPFSPPQVIYSRDLVPLIAAPWASPSSASLDLSRLLQAIVISRLSASCTLQCYSLWIFIAVTRTLSGFLLSRSVGWAYPRLFNHWALYESSSGIGPALITYVILLGAPPWTDFVVSRFKNYRTENTDSLTIVFLGALLCWLDNAPWTYSVAALVAATIGIMRIACKEFTHDHTTTRYPMALDGQDVAPTYRRARIIIQTALLSLITMIVPNMLKGILSHPSFPPMPVSPRTSAPLLEVLVLSYPRPDDVASPSSLLSRTISSFLPFVELNTTALSVFTHALPHTSFSHAKEYFAESNVQFYADQDTHPDAHQGQYLHIAEAFRWAHEKQQKSEWIMLVEDDFPICGEWGWGGVRGVMNELEKGRHNSTLLDRWGGFVGTGGSGLIVHRSLLSVLIFLMRAHSDLISPLPPALPQRPADLIIQDCLLGNDPLCPRRPGGGSLVITSKLAMDHIGALSSTTKGRRYEEDKWKCGWRHPFHGQPEVVVVPI